MRPSSTLLSITLSVFLVALLVPGASGQIIDPETAPKAKITWEGSVASGLAKAKAANKPVLWVVMIEREVACRRMMRRVWKDQTVLAKAQGFVLIPCNPYPEEDLTLFDGVTARQVKANEAAFRTRYETRTEVIAPQHLITDAAGKLLVRKDYELDAKGLKALMDRGLKKLGKSGAGVAAGDPASGKPVVAKSTEEIESEAGESEEGESEDGEADEEEPTEEARRLVNLIIKAPSEEM